MEKKIEFSANVRVGAKPDHHPTSWVPVPDDLYKWIPMHVVDNRVESVKRFNVTLSPVEDPEHSPQDKPNYGWVQVETVEVGICIICHKKLRDHSLSELSDCRRDAYRKFRKLDKGLRDIHAHIEVEMDCIEAKHTPLTGVKEEET